MATHYGSRLEDSLLWLHHGTPDYLLADDGRYESDEEVEIHCLAPRSQD